MELASNCAETNKNPAENIFGGIFGASGVTRTPDLLITNQLLYRLSYTSKEWIKHDVS